MLDLTRQLDLLPPEKTRGRHMEIIGQGMLGSWVSMAMAKMVGGLSSIRLIDGDVVSSSNLSSQLYSLADALVERPKVAAMGEYLAQFAGCTPQQMPLFLTAETEFVRLQDIVLLLVDSIAVRRQIWQSFIVDQAPVNWLVDVRAGGEALTILTVKVHQTDAEMMYEESLYPEEEVLDLPCTGRAIMYTSLCAAALATRSVKRILMDQPVEPRIDLDLGDSLSMIV